MGSPTRLVVMGEARAIVKDFLIVQNEGGRQVTRHASGVAADIYSDGEYKSLRDTHNASRSAQPINTHKWTKASHDRWLIIDDIVYHCGHSLKDMGKKLCAITQIGTNPEDILKQVR